MLIETLSAVLIRNGLITAADVARLVQVLHRLVSDPLMGRMLIDDEEPVADRQQAVLVENLQDSAARRLGQHALKPTPLRWIEPCCESPFLHIFILRFVGVVALIRSAFPRLKNGSKPSRATPHLSIY